MCCYRANDRASSGHAAKAWRPPRTCPPFEHIIKETMENLLAVQEQLEKIAADLRAEEDLS